MNGTAAVRSRIAGAGLALAGALVAAAAALNIFDQKNVIVLGIIGLFLGPHLVYLSGNARLFFLSALGFCLPLEYSKFFRQIPHMGGEYGLRIDITDVLLGALCAFWLVRRPAPGESRLRFPAGTFPWILLIALTLVGVALGPWRALAGIEAVRMGKVLLLFVYLTNNLRTPADFRYFLLAVAGGCVFESFIALLQYFFDFKLGVGLPEAALLDQKIGGRVFSRVGALLGHPNLFSGYLAMVLPVSLALLFAPLRWSARAFCACVLVISAVALVLTLSRNGWVATSAGFLIVLVATLLHPRIRERTNVLRIGVVVAGAGILLLMGPVILNRFFQSDPAALEARYEMNRNALRMVAEKPVLGFGNNTYAYVMMAHPDLRPGRRSLYQEAVYGDPRAAPPIHNIYLQKWVEQGTVGLVVFLGMIVLIFRTAVRNLAVREPTVFVASAGAAAGCAGILIHGLADWVFWFPSIMRVFFALAGVSAAAALYRRRHE